MPCAGAIARRGGCGWIATCATGRPASSARGVTWTAPARWSPSGTRAKRQAATDADRRLVGGRTCRRATVRSVPGNSSCGMATQMQEWRAIGTSWTCRVSEAGIRMFLRLFVCMAMALLGSSSLTSEPLTSHQQLALDIYKELVETDTVVGQGDTARAAEAMAARLRTAGFSGPD